MVGYVEEGMQWLAHEKWQYPKLGRSSPPARNNRQHCCEPGVECELGLARCRERITDRGSLRGGNRIKAGVSNDVATSA
eukprot:scaffold132406_cov27-Tisochrysis_lutea.AAC.3